MCLILVYNHFIQIYCSLIYLFFLISDPFKTQSLVTATLFPARVTVYRCSRGGYFWDGKRRRSNTTSLMPPTTKIRQYSTTKYAGCEFHIKIVHPTHNDRDAEVILLTSFIFNVLIVYLYN